MLSILEQIRSSIRQQPQPDVGAPDVGASRTAWATTLSARLSHAVFFGLIGVAMLPRLDTPLDRNARLAPTPPRILATITPPAQPAKMSAAAPFVAPVARVAPPVFAATVPNSPDTPHQSTEVAVQTLTAQPVSTRQEQPRKAVKAARKLKLPKARLVRLLAPPKATLRETKFVAAEIKTDTLPNVVITASDGKPTGVALKVRDGKLSRIAKIAPSQSTTRQLSQKVTVEPDPSPRTKTEVKKPAASNDTVTKAEAYTVANVWSDEQISEARQTCSALMAKIDIVATEAAPLKEGSCGAPAALNVRQLGSPKVQIQPAAMLTCPMAAALHTWMTDKVQPAALAAFGSPVVRLISASSYSCRNRYGRADGPLSEHALGNALDLSGFVLADGRTVRVLQDWGPVARDKLIAPAANAPIAEAVTVATTKPPMKATLSMLGGRSLTHFAGNATSPKADTKQPEPEKDGATKGKPATSATDPTKGRSAFLHKVHAQACDVFGTVLGPEANDAHRNHFHFDMKERRHRAYCQ